MYAGVPMATPVRVASADARRDRPKSRTLTCPSDVMKILPGRARIRAMNNVRALVAVALAAVGLFAQGRPQPDWTKIEEEGLRHFQALVRLNTTDPPGGEKPAAEYLKGVLEAEGIPTQLFALEPHRPNLVARLKGS